jgi:hypothetical protein
MAMHLLGTNLRLSGWDDREFINAQRNCRKERAVFERGDKFKQQGIGIPMDMRIAPPRRSLTARCHFDLMKFMTEADKEQFFHRRFWEAGQSCETERNNYLVRRKKR